MEVGQFEPRRRRRVVRHQPDASSRSRVEESDVDAQPRTDVGGLIVADGTPGEEVEIGRSVAALAAPGHNRLAARVRRRFRGNHDAKTHHRVVDEAAAHTAYVGHAVDPVLGELVG
jgi:hypothetical protein